VTGRIPCARKRTRWALTFSREVKGFVFCTLVFRGVVFDGMTNTLGYM
jgi:hypothetical protein